MVKNCIVVGVHAHHLRRTGEPARLRTVGIPPISGPRPANTYETTFNVPFLPTGAVSRKVFNNSLLLGESAWGSAVADIIGQPARLGYLVQPTPTQRGHEHRFRRGENRRSEADHRETIT